MVPAIALYPSCRASAAGRPDGRERLIDYLVENFDELVYV